MTSRNIVANPNQIDYNPSSGWYQDLYLNQEVYRECLMELAAVLNMPRVALELHAFPKFGYVHLYRLTDTSPL